MDRSLNPMVVFACTVLLSPAIALHATDPAPDEPPPPPDPPVIQEQVEVLAEAPKVEVEAVGIDLMQAGREPNLGVALLGVPGVAGVRRAQSAVDPVVRGLARDRVTTQINGMPLHHACPGRMDPPSTILSASSIQGATVVKGLASVTLGPGGTGGRLLVSTDHVHDPGTARESHPWGRVSYDGARDGRAIGAGTNGGSGAFDYTVGAESLAFGDYDSAAGTRVPAGQDEIGGHLSIGHRPTPSQRWVLGAIYRKGERTDFPALPMNSDLATTRMLHGTYRFEPAKRSRTAPTIEARLGYSTVAHLMSNRGKPTRSMMEAETDGTADTWGGALSGRWTLTDRAIVQTGVDFTGLATDAVRERRMVMSGMTSFDHLWPDAGQNDVGLFAEYSQWIGAGWKIRLGARHDLVRSTAAAADDPGLGGRTIRESFVLFYGPDAADTDRDERLWSANVLLVRDVSVSLSVHVGAGTVQRPASVTERYYAFAPAPGGFAVGNPTLDAERKDEISAGVRFETAAVRGSVTAYRYAVRDFVKEVTLARADVDGDDIVDLVRGFDNVDATLIGGEIAAVFVAGPRWTIPVSIAYTRGEYGADRTPLPEIPPLEGRVAARMALGNRRSGWVEVGGRFVAEQTRVDPDFAIPGSPDRSENRTDGFAVWHARAALPLRSGLQLEVGVENLLDKEYSEHLTREAVLAVGDLATGQEIPQPGRSLFLGLRYRR